MVWLVSLNKVAYSYGYHTLFEGVDLLISKKNIYYIKGHNGCGKTTLLRIIAGLADPMQGEVNYNSIIYNDSHLHYLGHSLSLKPYLTVTEQVRLCPHRVCTERLQELLVTWSLIAYEHTLCDYLSAGQLKRLALIILILNNKLLWVLDEPYNALDKPACNVLDAFIIEHLSRGGAVVITSHTEPTIKNYSINHYELG